MVDFTLSTRVPVRVALPVARVAVRRMQVPCKVRTAAPAPPWKVAEWGSSHTEDTVYTTRRYLHRKVQPACRASFMEGGMI